jgi:hypothetical protein
MSTIWQAAHLDIFVPKLAAAALATAHVLSEDLVEIAKIPAANDSPSFVAQTIDRFEGARVVAGLAFGVVQLTAGRVLCELERHALCIGSSRSGRSRKTQNSPIDFARY